MKSPALLAGLCAALLAGGSARASTAYGSINNFDTVNDTGEPCHGFEIEIEDCHSTDITYTYDWNHYGTCKITQDDSIPGHPKCTIRWASGKNPDGSWAAYTAVPAGPIAATNGHMFTNPAVNFGGEHFGVGYYAAVGAVRYHWLVDDGAGNLVQGPAVDVATPTFTYYAPVAGAPAQVVAAIERVEAPEVHLKEFGKPVWVKEIRTSSHNKNKVKLRDLVSDDPGDEHDVNWRNNEPDEVEVEWEILQKEFNAVEGGQRGKREAAGEDLPDGDEVITRRYEFYEYTGPLDDESGEVGTDNVGPDGIHGDGIDTLNGVEVDFSTIEIVGKYLGSQMSAFDPAAVVGLVEHLQDGAVGEAYPDRAVVIAGGLPFTCTRSGDLPDGMAFDEVTGILSGVPTSEGEFTFALEAADETNPPVKKSYTISIAAAGEVLPPHAVVDTSVEPADSGTTAGDGAYGIGEEATVTATANPGFAFSYWSDNGVQVGNQASYSLTLDVNHALVAHFISEHPDRTIATTAAPVAGGTVAGAGIFADGGAVSLTATPNLGFNFVNWTENGTQVATTATYSFAATADHSLVANFISNGSTVRTLALASSPALGGTVTGAGSYADKTRVTIVATPNPGFLFDRWTEGNSKFDDHASVTFTLNKNLTLAARFVPAYTIATSVFPEGAGGAAGGGLFKDKDNVTVIASPNPGYFFSGWTENGALVSNLASYQFKANPSHTLVANFSLVMPETRLDHEQDGALAFHWPIGLPGWVLEQCDDLQEGSWRECEMEVEDLGGEHRVRIVPEEGVQHRYFRLRHP